ncbi:MAG: argininosuccinate lyase [bacterium]
MSEKKPTKKNPTAKKPWSGRFSADTDSLMEAFSASVAVDRRLYRHDLRASLAHARMLAAAGVLSADELRDIERGLADIAEQIERGEFAWSDALEDVHMNIEARLIESIGAAGKKLHTARSRNDQVATDMRLYLREQTDRICGRIGALQRAIVVIAGDEAATAMPGFTHLQTAQPVTLGHHLLAWNEMLQRDYERLRDSRKRLNISPLGSAALAGTGFAIDRAMTAAELGFDAVTRNSLDAVSDRDFAIEFVACAALMMVHLSRIAEELVLWSSDAFGFIDLGDAFCTGSSIMPQKKNPDAAELVRGKCARVNGDLIALLMLMKSQPLAYNRDNQEDKEPLFDSVDTALQCLSVLAAMLPQTTWRRDAMRAAAARGHPTATDLADYLVGKGVSFRDAHHAVGGAVGFAVERGVELAQIDLADLRRFHPAIEDDVHAVLSIEGSLAARDHIGGTAPTQVAGAAQAALKALDVRAEAEGE